MSHHSCALATWSKTKKNHCFPKFSILKSLIVRDQNLKRCFLKIFLLVNEGRNGLIKIFNTKKILLIWNTKGV